MIEQMVPPGSGTTTQPYLREPDEPRWPRVVMVAVVAALLLCAAAVWSASRAAFSGTTSNASNTWGSGKVSLTDDDANGVLFSATGIMPGTAAVSNCIQVTYTGTVTSTVHVYADTYTHSANAPTVDPANGLGQYLTLTVEQDTNVAPNGAFGGCGNFTAGNTIYSGNVYDFSTRTYASNYGTWAPTGAGQTKVYRFTYSVTDTNAAQDLNCGVRFVFEAQA